MAYRKRSDVDMQEPGTFNARAFYQTLCVQRATRKLTWRRIARDSGVYAGLFSRLERGCHPGVDAFGRLCRWMGKPMAVFFYPDPPPPPPP